MWATGRQEDPAVPLGLCKLRPFGAGATRQIQRVPNRLVCADLVVDMINEVYRDYHSFLKRDGTPRKWSTQRVLRLDGQDRPDNTSYDFARKWAEYHEAWHLLEDA